MTKGVIYEPPAIPPAHVFKKGFVSLWLGPFENNKPQFRHFVVHVFKKGVCEPLVRSI